MPEPMTSSITWPAWVTAYFVVGAVAMALLVKLKASNQNTFKSRLAKIMQDKLDQTKSPTQRFIDQRLLPGIFLVLLWPFWPILILIRLWIAYRQPSDATRRPTDKRQDTDRSTHDSKNADDDPYTKPHDRIILVTERIERVSVDDAEKRHQISDPLGAVPALPFGHMNSVWLHLRRQLTPQRTLWRFRCTRTGALEDFKDFEAFEGYAVFDRNTYVDHMVTEFVWPEAVLAHEPVVARRQ